MFGFRTRILSTAAVVVSSLTLSGCVPAPIDPPCDGTQCIDSNTAANLTGTTEPAGPAELTADGSPIALPPSGHQPDRFALWSTGTNLRGANVYQRRVYPALDGADFIGPGPIGPPMTQSDFDQLAASGANYVNISHPGLFSENPPYGLDPAVQANLDSLVEMTARAGLFVVISFRTGPGRSEFSIFEGQGWFPQSLVNNHVWNDATAQQAWSGMWSAAAARYRDRAHIVGYDLMVEPNGPSTQFNIWDPAEFYATRAGSLADWNSMVPPIVAAIRAVDADTPILVSAAAYGSLNWLPFLAPLGDARTVYTVHHYTPFEFSHQNPGENVSYPGAFAVDGVVTTVDRDWLSSLLSVVDNFQKTHGATVAINEFGVKRFAPGAAAYFRDQTDLFEQRGINYALWIWESNYPGLATIDDFNFRHGPDPLNHADRPGSDLETAIRNAFAKNAIRPAAIRN